MGLVNGKPSCPVEVDLLVTPSGRRDLRICSRSRKHKGRHRFQVALEDMKTGQRKMATVSWR